MPRPIEIIEAVADNKPVIDVMIPVQAVMRGGDSAGEPGGWALLPSPSVASARACPTED